MNNTITKATQFKMVGKSVDTLQAKLQGESVIKAYVLKNTLFSVLQGHVQFETTNRTSTICKTLTKL